MLDFLNQREFPETGIIFNKLFTKDVEAPVRFSGPQDFRYRIKRESRSVQEVTTGIRRQDMNNDIIIETQDQGITFRIGDKVRIKRDYQEREYTITQIDKIFDDRNESNYMNMTSDWPGLVPSSYIYTILLR